MGITEAELAILLQRQADANPSLFSAPAKAKAPKPRQNKWEEAYERELRQQWGSKSIQWYGFEAVKLRLAGNTFYTPDFAVMDDGDLEFHEVKGFWRDDALVKFKVAAEQFPFLFVAYRMKRISEGGGWEIVKLIDGRVIWKP